MTWNCQGAFRKKYPLIARLAPDLAVIQECEHPERLVWKEGNAPTTALWFGENRTKGLGIFSWTGLSISVLAGYDPTIRYCIPLEISAPLPFRLIAVWAMDHPKDALSYSAQVYQAAAVYREFILGGDTVVMGDFNCNQKNTPRSRLGNSTALANGLDDLWLASAYHHFFHEVRGKETQATFFHGRHMERPAHIDYAYVPVRWLRRLKRVQVGGANKWLEFSDHCPLSVEFTQIDETHMV